MSLKKQATVGVFWTFFEMFGGQLINFFVNMVLARKLMPDDYGLLGMIYIFITISNTLMDSGLSPSLMRRKSVRGIDYSTTFVTHIVFSALFYFIFFFTAPIIADFYGREELVSIIRVFSSIIILQGFVQIQSIYLIKNLNFKKQTLIKLPAIIISSTVAIYLAYNGFGVWSLVCMYVLQSFFWTLFHWIFGDWNVSFSFDKVVFNEHFNYGYKISIVEILNNVTNNIYQIVLGKFYETKNAGYYTQSLTLYQIPFSNIYAAILKVLFPVFAMLQDDKAKMKASFIKCQEFLILIMYPIFIFLLFNAEGVLVVLFSEKWRSAGIYLQALCLAALFNILINWQIQILKLMEESVKILKYELLMKLILFMLIFAVIYITRDVKSLLLTIPVAAVLNLFYINGKSTKVLNLNFFKPLSIALLYLSFGVVSILIVRFLSMDSMLLSLMLKGLFFITIYVMIVFVARKRTIIELINLIKR